MANTRDLIIRILADTSKLSAEVGKAEGAFGKLKSGALAVGGAFAAGFAAKEVIGFLGDSAKAAEEDRKSQQLLATQIRTTTQATDEQIAGVEGFINTLSRATGVADDQLRPAYASLLRGSKDTATAQTELALAMDIAAARGVSLETVAVALEKAHNGNTAGLGRMGIAMKDAEGNQLSLEQAVAQATETYAGAAEAAVTPSQRMSVAWSELQEQVGTLILPALEKLTTFLAEEVLPAVQEIVVSVQEHWPEISAVIERVVGVVRPILENLFLFLKTQFDVITGIIEVFSALLSGDFSKAWEAVEETVGKVWENITKAFGNTIDLLKQQISNLWAIGGDVIIGAVNAAIGFFEATVNKLIDVVNVALDLLDKAAGPLINFGEVSNVKFGRLGGGSAATPGTGVMAGATSLTKLAEGGTITRTGVALVHRGETVVPAGAAAGGAQVYIASAVFTAQTESELYQQLVALGRRQGGIRIPGGVTAVS